MRITFKETEGFVNNLTALDKIMRELGEKGVQYHTAGRLYTSLMISFLLQIGQTIDVLLTMWKKNGSEWFPVTNGFIMLRSLFELGVIAHYMSQKPEERAKSFIEQQKLERGNRIKKLKRIIESNSSWRIPAELLLRDWELKGIKEVSKASCWENKKLWQMAKEADHKEAYDYLYSELSGYTHISADLADHFLKATGPELKWSMRSDEKDVGFVFLYACSITHCFMSLFAKQFNIDIQRQLDECMEIGVIGEKEYPEQNQVSNNN